MDHTDVRSTDRGSGSTVPETVDRVRTLLAAHRQREVHLAEQIHRLEIDLTDLQASVATATGELKRLRSRYTVALGPDGQITNAERLYELLARDAHQIAQELALSLPVTRPRGPYSPQP